jgi:type VI secretion system secreted protein Hcp
MASEIFLKIDGIKGESKDVNHVGEIEASSWSWAVSEVIVTSGGGSGGGAGKPKVGELIAGKTVDRASPELLRTCLTGKHVKEVVLTERHSGTANVHFLAITLQEVLVTSVSDVEAGVGQRPSESLTFNFGKIIYEYVPQKPNGQPDTPVVLRWDVKANAEF